MLNRSTTDRLDKDMHVLLQSLQSRADAASVTAVVLKTESITAEIAAIQVPSSTLTWCRGQWVIGKGVEVQVQQCIGVSRCCDCTHNPRMHTHALTHMHSLFHGNAHMLTHQQYLPFAPHPTVGAGVYSKREDVACSCVRPAESRIRAKGGSYRGTCRGGWRRLM